MNWDEIRKDWLIDSQIDYSPEEALEGFREVESVLKIDLHRISELIRGAAIAIHIIDLGHLLICLKKIHNGKVIMQKLVENNPFTKYDRQDKQGKGNTTFERSPEESEYAHALSVARLAVHYTKQGYYTEIEPELAVNNRKKYPDLRVRVDAFWVYIEVVSPNHAQEIKDAYCTMEKLSDVKNELKKDTLIEIFLLKDPNDQEVQIIREKCKFLANNPSVGENMIEGIALLAVSSENKERLATFPMISTEKRPILVVVGFIQSVENGCIHFNRVVVNLPITDERAQMILNGKKKQLSRTDPGLIVIDVSNVPGGFKSWPFLISDRLQPNLNRRITAVLFVNTNIVGNKIVSKKVLVNHPNPIHELPESFFKVTAT